MKILRKLSEEKGSITMTVVAAMLFITSAILIAYFSLSNQSNDQSKKTRQIADSYKVTNSDLVQKYKEVQDDLNEITTMSITKVKTLGNTMFAKGTNTVVTDELGNNFVVPTGFKVTDDANNVTEGMVIQDKDGNEFVWIPVGDIRYEESGVKKIKTIDLGRYDFASDGTPSTYTGSTIEEDSTKPELLKNYGNAIAKNINEFITKTNEAGGYYVGRYEARKNSEEKLTEVKTHYVKNNILQSDAAYNSRNMYNNSEFESDLMNSYAWETAIVFIQTFSSDSDYSKQQRTTTTYAQKGTDSDIRVNIYDMKNNCREWTTETANNPDKPCVRRGGCCSAAYTTDSGDEYAVSNTTTSTSYRPILYIK